jgi:hypothetical protein
MTPEVNQTSVMLPGVDANDAEVGRRVVLKALAGACVLSPAAVRTAPATGREQALSFDQARASLNALVGPQWRQSGLFFVREVNRFHRALDAWQVVVDAGRKTKERRPDPPPVGDRRVRHAAVVMKFARTWMTSATAEQVAQWRVEFPFSYSALIERHENEVCSVDQCLATSANGCLVVVKKFRGSRRLLGALEAGQWRFDASVHCIGRSHDRRFWAFATTRGIELRRGWAQATTVLFPYPVPQHSVPGLSPSADHQALKEAEVLIPFNDGKRLILANRTGVYLLQKNSPVDFSTRRLHPQASAMQAAPGEPVRVPSLSLLHVALSPDEKYIALGDQDSDHLLLNAQGDLIAKVSAENWSHHAVFDQQSKHVWFNDDNRQSGFTVTAELAQLNGSSAAVDGKPVELKTRLMDAALQIFSSIQDANGVYLGGSGGYIQYVNHAGECQWRHHFGGSVNAIDFSPDGKTLWASSYSGMLERYEIKPGTADPQRIGNSPLWDSARWIFMADMTTPLSW